MNLSTLLKSTPRDLKVALPDLSPKDPNLFLIAFFFLRTKLDRRCYFKACAAHKVKISMQTGCTWLLVMFEPDNNSFVYFDDQLPIDDSFV